MKIAIGQQIISALRNRDPLVALETALVTHGLPKPLHIKTALAMEAAVRRAGSIPCTIGVIRGTIIIGMTEDELQQLALEANPSKLGLRELPVAVAQGLSGGTTVAATAYLAHRYGVRIFATGGIGGVHRGGADTFDISGDLTTLGKIPLTVVTSGAKAILDLKLTLEYLETMAITVVGFKTSTFPAFYSATSPYALSLRVESAAQAVQVAVARDQLGLHSAVLICSPVAIEAEIPFEELMLLIATMENASNGEQVVGQDVTPAMLHRLVEHSGGRSLQANVRLLVDNAMLGGEIAFELAKQGRESYE